MDKPKLTENGHTEDCNRRKAKYEADLAAFEQAHPNYCRVCGGRGGFAYNYDPSPAGVSLSPGYMTEVEPCSECVERGVCPLCTQHTLDEDGEKCSNCEWKWDDPNVPSKPEFECYCWEYEAYEYDDREMDAFEAYNDGERAE